MTHNPDNPADNEDAYVPTYWMEDEALPAPTGIFRTFIATNNSQEAQRKEATTFLQLIKAVPVDIGTLALTTTPVPVIIKVPGTNKIKFILGIAPCFQDPFATSTSAMHGEILGIDGDIDDPGETPVVRRLPKTVFNLRKIQTPAPDVFEEKLQQADDGRDGKEWFKQSKLTGEKWTAQLAMVAPLPPYLAYDALNTEVEAHKLYDRIKLSSLREEAPEVYKYAISFLIAVHTAIPTSKDGVDLGTEMFLARAHPHAKAWAKERANKLFPVEIPKETPATPNRSSDITLLAQAIADRTGNGQGSTAPTPVTPPQDQGDTEPDVFKTYGMCKFDLKRFLVMCGRKEGQESMLPEWPSQLAAKNHSL